jgi:hypothetical protein
VAAIVLALATSCCPLLGGPTAPPVTPVPISAELALELRDRINQVKAAQGPFSIEISDEELTSYLVYLLQSGPGQFPARDVRVRFDAGYAEIWATFIDIAPTELPVYVRAEAAAVDGELVFVIDQANAGFIAVPGAMRELVAQVLSESLAELQLGLEIEGVQIQAGRMLLTGRVTGYVPDLP